NRIDQHLLAGTYFLRVETTAGAGTFTVTTTLTPASEPFHAIPVGTDPQSLVTSDFNGDGRLDLVAGSDVLLGDGDGTFQAQASYAAGTALVTGDFNGDSRLDLAVAGGSNVWVLFGYGDGNFLPQATYYAVDQDAVGIVTGDFNGDGHLDLATANSYAGSVS